MTWTEGCPLTLHEMQEGWLSAPSKRKQSEVYNMRCTSKRKVNVFFILHWNKTYECNTSIIISVAKHRFYRVQFCYWTKYKIKLAISDDFGLSVLWTTNELSKYKGPATYKLIILTVLLSYISMVYLSFNRMRFVKKNINVRKLNMLKDIGSSTVTLSNERSKS